MTGTVKFFNISKGFGFITNDETGEDMFVHSTALDGITIKEGDNEINIFFDKQTYDLVGW